MPYLEALRSAVFRAQCTNSTKAWKHCTAATWNAAVVHAGLTLTQGHSAWHDLASSQAIPNSNQHNYKLCMLPYPLTTHETTWSSRDTPVLSKWCIKQQA